jgi:hypothetical protein
MGLEKKRRCVLISQFNNTFGVAWGAKVSWTPSGASLGVGEQWRVVSELRKSVRSCSS